jgi:hypothetical protein
MMKALAMGVASLGALAFAACTQGEMEEAGEEADTATEQATTGETNLGQGPMEEAGERADEAAGEANEGLNQAGDAIEGAGRDAADAVNDAADGDESTETLERDPS